MKTKLKGSEINSIYCYYENLIVEDKDGNTYFLNPRDLVDLLHEADFFVKKKTTRTWLETRKFTMSEDDQRRLSSILFDFETATKNETGVKKISGGFAQAEYSSHDGHFIYVNLKWGVQNDVDNDVHEEDWKLPIQKFLIKNISNKYILSFLEPCN